MNIKKIMINKPAAFLDRDGTINIDRGYIYQRKDFEWTKDAQEAIKYLYEKDFYIFIVTNQSGISRGYYSEKDVVYLHKYINDELRLHGAKIHEFFYSPYHPDGLSSKYDHLKKLRKPNTGMLELANSKWPIDKQKSFMIGDKQSDIKCGESYGIKSFLYDGNRSLLHFVKSIVNNL
jgi:D-glycero-D-manno-heptose 1,7-bisphosphate phosphatase